MQDREKFEAAMAGYRSGTVPAESVVNCLGPNRRAETAQLARDELKRILERREEIQDLHGLDSGPLWTVEEEKTFEYGLYMYDSSTHDRFGMISNLMYGSRTRDECKKRYMKLLVDMCQIEMGQQNLTVFYRPSPVLQQQQQQAPPSIVIPPPLPSPGSNRATLAGQQVWMM